VVKSHPARLAWHPDGPDRSNFPQILCMRIREYPAIPASCEVFKKKPVSVTNPVLESLKVIYLSGQKLSADSVAG
jgi:hypothetical protein